MKPFNEFAYTFACRNSPGTGSKSAAFEVLETGLAETCGLLHHDAQDLAGRLFARCLRTAEQYGMEPGDSVTVSLYAEGLDYAPGETSPCPRQGYSVTAERTETGFAYTTRGFVYHRRGAPADAVNDVRTRLIRAGQNMGVTV